LQLICSVFFIEKNQSDFILYYQLGKLKEEEYNEKDISTKKKNQKKRAWIFEKNENYRWKECG